MDNFIADFYRIFVDNIVCMIKGDYEQGRVDLNDLGNLALLSIDRRSITPSLKNTMKLTMAEKRCIRRFYKPYVRYITTRYHRYYTSRNGHFSPYYIPEDLYLMWIDRYFCGRTEAKYLDNKCYYYRLLSNIKLPEAVVMRIGDSFLDGNLRPVTELEAAELVGAEDEVVVKRAVNSEGGYGVEFMAGSKLEARFSDIMGNIPCDVVIQKPIRQHKDLAALHPESVNTMRIVSLKTGDKVKVYKVCLKIGVGKERIDNGCHGGIYCGVRSDGTLRDYGVLDNGKVLHRHPDLGYAFGDKKVPHLGRAVKLVKEAHSFMGHFRLVAWDVSIDEHGEAVLVEANLTLGGINDVQLCSGPLFGKDTKKILDEVFKDNRKAITLL